VHDRATAPQAQLPVALANPLRSGAEIGLVNGQATVYDIQGSLVRSWTGMVRWDGQGLQSGIYLLKVTSGSQTFSRQFVLTH
jgi:hypothetical protein